MKKELSIVGIKEGQVEFSIDSNPFVLLGGLATSIPQTKTRGKAKNHISLRYLSDRPVVVIGVSQKATVDTISERTSVVIADGINGGIPAAICIAHLHEPEVIIEDVRNRLKEALAKAA